MIARKRAHATSPGLALGILVVVLVLVCPIGLVLAADFHDDVYPPEPYDPVIAVNIGNTHSSVAVARKGVVDLIPDQYGNYRIPSYVAFAGDEVLVGQEAKAYSDIDPGNTFNKFKRYIGRSLGEFDFCGGVRGIYTTRGRNAAGKSTCVVDFEGRRQNLTVEEITAHLVKELKQNAESFLGQEVKDAVITVPTDFKDEQRQAMKDACISAGLEVLRVVNESTAAAMAYKLDMTADERLILVYHLGGKTFHVTVLSVDEGVYEVLATETGPSPSPWGWRHESPSGEELDRRILEHVVNHLRKHFDSFDMFNETARRLIRDEAVRAKHHLSTHPAAQIDLKGISAGVDYEHAMTRDKFEEINRDLFRSTLRSVEKALKQAKLSSLDIDDIILVGGASRTPFIQEMLRDYFVLSPLGGIEPDEAVVRGAVRQAQFLTNDHDGYCAYPIDYSDFLYDENGRFGYAPEGDRLIEPLELVEGAG